MTLRPSGGPVLGLRRMPCSTGSTEVNWHGHRQVVNLQCESLWRSASLTVSLDPSFARLINLHGRVIRVEGWWDSNGEQALGHRKSLRAETVLLSLRSETMRVIGLLLWSPRRSRSTSEQGSECTQLSWGRCPSGCA